MLFTTQSPIIELDDIDTEQLPRMFSWLLINLYNIFILFYLLGTETDKYYTNTSLANVDLDAQAALIYANIFHKGFCDH